MHTRLLCVFSGRIGSAWVWETRSLPSFLLHSVDSDICWLVMQSSSLSCPGPCPLATWLRRWVKGVMTEIMREQWKTDLHKGGRQGPSKSLYGGANERSSEGVRWERVGKGGAEGGEERSCRCSRRPTAAERRSCQSRLCVALTPLILFCSARPPYSHPTHFCHAASHTPCLALQNPTLKGDFDIKCMQTRLWIYMPEYLQCLRKREGEAFGIQLHLQWKESEGKAASAVW